MASTSKKASAWGFGNGGGQKVEWRRVTDHASDADAKKKQQQQQQQQKNIKSVVDVVADDDRNNQKSSSSSNYWKKKKEKKEKAKAKARAKAKAKKEKQEDVEYRNWGDDLPWPALSLIMTKIGGIDLLMNAQLVCRSWWQVSLDPTLWRITDMRPRQHHGHASSYLDMESMAVVAVNRSNGLLEKFYAEYFGNDHLLTHIADRSTKLKCLCLISAFNVSDEGLAVAISRFPHLEELDLTHCSFTDQVCKLAGQACPRLKCFRLNSLNSRYQLQSDDEYYEDEFSESRDEQALGIANTMPHLIRLQLIGNSLTNEGLKAILDKCVHLESLDIRRCFGVNLDSGLKEKCGKIKDLRLPNDSTEDYGWEFEDGYGSYSDYLNSPEDLFYDYYDYYDEFDDELGSPSSDIFFDEYY